MAGSLANKNSKPAVIIPVPDDSADASTEFVGRWNTLVSTTNWEKGRIIGQWRVSQIEAGAAPSEYSDEAWSLLVGGVTGQHVGRLRRVHERFGDTHEQFAGLYWSHFQAALDWDDAEMWLEGAVQNRWSVSQMRHQRWETLGAVAKDKPQDEDIVASELDEDFEPAQGARPGASSRDYDETQSSPRRDGPDFGDDDAPGKKSKGRDGATVYSEVEPHLEIVRPFANLAELPDDLADAFESFKLAILRHKAGGWEAISRDDVLATLDALKELALAPSSESAPF
ncbi:MAG: hypothetical protein KDA41_14260 [Planctomycetales bacterium]|nr:hypothetical protein [Planctomycetales bacterium]